MNGPLPTHAFRIRPPSPGRARRPGPTALVVLVLAALTALPGCVVQKNPVSGNRRAYAYSWEEEIRIGTEADGQIISQYGLYDDEGLTEWVDSLGQALLDVSHLRRGDTDEKFRETPFTFRLLDSPVINAFALPGGFVYVTRGLMAHLENEAQLAVVLGHEIGHVAARHASQRALSQQARQIGLVAGAIGGQAVFGGETAQSILNVGSMANQFITLSYGRDDERESDNLGVEYAALLGYDAAEGAAFFRTLERLGEQSGQEIPGFLSTHPDPGERNETIQRIGADWSERLGGTDRVERDALFERVDGIVFGEDPRQGFVEGGFFNHPDLAFRFPVPAGFQLVNQPTRVAMIAENQDAYIVMTIDSEHASAQEAAEALAGNQSLTVVRSGVGQANGLPSRFVVADATTEDGTELRIRAQYIDYDGTVYAFTGVTTRARYTTYESGFVGTMQGFRALTDASLLNVQPERVAVRRTAGQARFRSLIAGSLPQDVSEESIAILNQVELDDILEAGRLYKAVR